jgi:AhpD family alkylhydroperoxidase
MARIPYDISASSGLNLHRLLSYSAGAQRVHALAYYIRSESSVDPRLRELAILQVGYVMRCRYEYVHHAEIALRSGVTPDDIACLAQESAGKVTDLDPLTRAVLAAARETAAGTGISDETFAVLDDALTREQLVDLVLAIAFYVFTVCVLTNLSVDLEPEYEELARQYPLPTA